LNGADGADGQSVNMNSLIDYLGQTNIDVGDWSIKSESKLDQLSEGGLQLPDIDVQSTAQNYLNGGGVSLSSNTCPPAETINILGSDVSFSYQPLCDLASLLRPLLLAFTWLFAMVLYFRSL
jgi:hypothetical protein